MDKPPESAPAPAQEAPEIRHILVPTDFSACAEVALDYALRLAQPLHASVELCHVGPQPDYAVAQLVSPGMRIAALGLVDQLRVLFEAARKEMDDLLQRKAVGGVALTSSFIEGFPDEGIVMRARQTRADLIVIGSHGRRGLSRVLLGSITERVLRLAPCPVLVVHNPAEEGTKSHGG